jgi:O-antigen/teichoic acid export membrane protein
LAAPILMMLFFSNSFHIALPLMPWLAIGFIFRLIFMHDSLYEFYAPRFWPLPMTTITGGLLMLALTPVLIPVAGIAAPGIAFAVSRAGMAFAMHGFSRPNRVYQAFTPLLIVMLLLLLGFGVMQWILPETHTLWMVGIGIVGIVWSMLRKA